MSAYTWLLNNSYQYWRPVKHAWAAGHYAKKLHRQHYTQGYQNYINQLDYDWRLSRRTAPRLSKTEWQRDIKIYPYKRWLKHARKWAKISRRAYIAKKQLQSNLEHYKRRHPEGTLDDFILNVGKRVKYI